MYFNEHMAISSCKNYEKINIISLHPSDIVFTIVTSKKKKKLL